MKPYDAGSFAALKSLGLEKTAVYPEEYNSSGIVGGVSGAIGGGAAGGALGNMLAKHIGEITRYRLMGLGIPGTGAGEAIFTTPKGPIYGEAAGSLLGSILGGATGANLGHLQALRHAPPPRTLQPYPFGA